MKTLSVMTEMDQMLAPWTEAAAIFGWLVGFGIVGAWLLAKLMD